MALRKFALDATALTVARIFQVAANALSLPILARLLQPSDFGLMAAANSILFLASVLADAGLASSLVRTSFNERRVWSSVFWLTTGWSAGLALLLVVFAVPLGWVLKDPNVAPLIAGMAIFPFGLGLLAAPTADLQQRKMFGWISASDIVGAIAGIAAAVWLAAVGAGPWALVAQSLTALAVKAVVICGKTRFRPILAFDRHLITEHLHFARDTGAFALALFFSTQMSNIMIARSAGPGPLGVFSMATRITSLLSLPASAFGALYPRFVTLRQDKQAMRQLVLMVTTLLAIIIVPPTAMLCAASESVFTVLFSDRWNGVAEVFCLLAPVGALQAIGGIHVSVLMAVGRTDTRLRLTIEYLILWMVVLISVAHLGIYAVALGQLVSYLAYYPRFLALFLRPIECRIVDYVRVMLVPLCVSATMAMAHVALRPYFSVGPLLETCIAVLESLIAYAVIGLLMWRHLLETLKSARSVFRIADEEAC